MTLLQNSLVIAAKFKIIYDGVQFSATCSALKRRFRSAFGENLDFCLGQAASPDTLYFDMIEDALVEPKFPFSNELKVLKDELNTLEQLVALSTLTALEKFDYILFLTNVLAKGPFLLRKEFNKTEMSMIYQYITKVSWNIERFKPLPIPTAISMELKGEDNNEKWPNLRVK